MQYWRPFLLSMVLMLALAACGRQSTGQVADIQATKRTEPEVKTEQSAGSNPSDPTLSVSELTNPPNDCPITPPSKPLFRPPQPYPPNSPYEGTFWHGTDKLWTMLTTDGTWAQLPHHEGGYTQKLVWWRQGYDWHAEPNPDLTIVAQRLDGAAPTVIVSDATNGYQPDVGSFMLAGIDFPTLGCWEITGQVKDQTLSFVVWIAP